MSLVYIPLAKVMEKHKLKDIFTSKLQYFLDENLMFTLHTMTQANT